MKQYLYCGTCRTWHSCQDSVAQPPYAAVHRYDVEPEETHVHPITREVLSLAAQVDVGYYDE